MTTSTRGPASLSGLSGSGSPNPGERQRANLGLPSLSNWRCSETYLKSITRMVEWPHSTILVMELSIETDICTNSWEIELNYKVELHKQNYYSWFINIMMMNVFFSKCWLSMSAMPRVNRTIKIKQQVTKQRAMTSLHCSADGWNGYVVHKQGQAQNGSRSIT